MKRLSIEKLVFGHSLVSNNYPKGLGLQTLGIIQKQEGKSEIEKLGLFDSATPNFSNYYPGATAEDLKPKDDEFVYPIFRALSEVLVRRNAPVDFSLNGVLKNAMNKLYGQTVYPNHEQLIGNQLGVVIDVEWQDSYTTNGIKIPSGINSRFKLDGKANPNIARAVMMEPPSIHSTSVTVEFAWEKSHNLTDDEFFNKLGSSDDKGNLYKRNVTDIVNFHEISLVPHGADSFAQRLDKDGKIVNPKYAQTVYKFGANNDEENYQSGKIHFIDYKNKLGDIEKLSDDKTTIPFRSNNNQESLETNQNMKNILIKLLLLSGIASADIEKLSDDDLGKKAEETFNKFVADSTEVVKLKADIELVKVELTQKDSNITDLTQKISDKEAELSKLINDAEVGKLALTQAKSEAVRLYNLAMGAKSDTKVLELIANADYNTTIVLMNQYAILAESSFQASCKDCHSKNISRMSSAASGGETSETTINKSNDDVMSSLTMEKNPVRYLG